jgi:hypothetical protein
MIPHRRTILAGTLALLAAALTSGCVLLGLAAYAAPKPNEAASYHGLTKKRVAVMVWTDRAMSIDWPKLQLDLARGIQSRLVTQTQQKSPPKELEGTTFAAVESVIRFQRDHPETETQAITDVAPRMDIDRLIYIEIEQFSTRPEESLELFRGSLTANVKVVENLADGKAKVGFQADRIKVTYPSKTPDEGVPGLNDGDVYERTLEEFAIKVVNEFVPHPPPENADLQ